MIVVSDSSPLIALARIDCLDFLPKLFNRIHVPTEVYNEVVMHGAGLPGAREVELASWIDVRKVGNTEALRGAIEDTGLGAGEMGTIFLTQELGADAVLIDERKARRTAEKANLFTLGCIGVLEILYKQQLVPDLRVVYERLLAQDFRIDAKTLQVSLQKFGLAPL